MGMYSCSGLGGSVDIPDFAILLYTSSHSFPTLISYTLYSISMSTVLHGCYFSKKEAGFGEYRIEVLGAHWLYCVF